MLRWLSPINAWISRLCMYVAVAGLLGIVGVVAYQVFGRYVLNDTPTWAESLALVLVLYVTMFGAAVGVRMPAISALNPCWSWCCLSGTASGSKS